MSDNSGIDLTVSTDQSFSSDAILKTSASELMDDLFAQLDQKLKEGASPPVTASSSLSTLVRARQALSVLGESSDLEVSYTPLEATLAPRQTPDWQLSLDETIGIGNPQDSKFNQRLFVCIALTSIGAALVWIGTQLVPRSVTAPVVAEATAPSLAANPADRQFAASMTQHSRRPHKPSANRCCLKLAQFKLQHPNCRRRFQPASHLLEFQLSGNRYGLSQRLRLRLTRQGCLRSKPVFNPMLQPILQP
jgi:hypothetical protein